jgi:hypothetical protein
LKDTNGEPLFVGDIVIIHNVIGYNYSLTAVVNDKYFLDAYNIISTKKARESVSSYIMGIEISFNDTQQNNSWQIYKVKSFNDVVENEFLPEPNITYRKK